MNVYRGSWHPKKFNGAPEEQFVTVENDVRIFRLRHHERHSPDGFAWGYEGSGPSELARCILLDFARFNMTRSTEADFRKVVDERVDLIYQDFKRDVIAGFDKDQAWILTAGEIWQWLKAQTSTACIVLRACHRPDFDIDNPPPEYDFPVRSW